MLCPVHIHEWLEIMRGELRSTVVYNLIRKTMTLIQHSQYINGLPAVADFTDTTSSHLEWMSTAIK